VAAARKKTPVKAVYLSWPAFGFAERRVLAGLGYVLVSYAAGWLGCPIQGSAALRGRDTAATGEMTLF
jgi:hypothetical protein